MVKLGDPQKATLRLNFAQSFNGLAAFLAPLVGGKFILNDHPVSDAILASMSEKAKQAYLIAEASSVKGPYAIIGSLILLLAVVFVFIKLPKLNDEKEVRSSIRDAFSYRQLRFAAVAQFFYVGAQVSVLSFFIRFASSSADLSVIEASWFAGGAGLAFMVGRFIGTYLMRFTAPQTLLAIYAAICFLLCILAIGFHGMITVYALIAIAFFMSIMFPTIFSLGISGLGDHTKIGSSIIVMSIVGGALLPLLLGFISDVSGHIQYGFSVPAFCFIVVFLFGWRFWKPNLSTISS